MDGEQIRDQARSLRLAGKSCRQVAEALGITPRAAERLVAGLPVPEWTRRPRAKDELRARARELRAQGWTYPEIAAELGVSRSSCSLWLRDMPHPPRYTPERVHAMWERRWKPWLRERAGERQLQTFEAAREIGKLTDRELLIAGAVLYWAEGSKSKPWRRAETAVFVNSDPDLIRLYLAWLQLLEVTTDKLAVRVQIHESADVDAAIRYWSEVTGVPTDRFGKTTLKRHNPRTNRRNTGDTYHGCLTIAVRQSGDLYRKIVGWVNGIVAGGLSAEPSHGTVVPAPVLDVARLRAHLPDRSRVV